jgi:NADH-quinone oxidoreductase subunit N
VNTSGFNGNDLIALASPLLLMVSGMVVLLWGVYAKRSRNGLLVVSLVGSLVALAAAVFALGLPDTRAFAGGMISDDFGNLFNVALCVIAFLSVLMSDRYAEEHQLNHGEYYSLILLSTSGASLMAMANDLVNVFLGLEVLSIALYILAGFARRDQRSEEASVKYFLLGSFASGFLLYGTALVYGAVGLAARTAISAQGVTGSFTNFDTIRQVLDVAPATAGNPVFVAGVALIIVGLGFKASIVPFHVWTADVYEGAPTTVTAFMSAAAKIGAFAAFIRVFQMLITPDQGGPGEVVQAAQAPYEAVLWILAALTMVIGNVLAIRQTNIKRMLAYSSIAHAGYILVGVLAWAVSGSELTRGAMLYYLFAYTFMNLGAFAVVIWMGRQGQEYLDIREYRGLARRQPLAALAMAVFMLSLAGIPPTAGFFGKLYVFLGAVGTGRTNLVWLAAIGLVVSVIGVFYYLRIIVQMYFEAPEREFGDVAPGIGARAVAFIAAVATIVLGIAPLRVLVPTPDAPRTAGEPVARSVPPAAVPSQSAPVEAVAATRSSSPGG